MTISKKKTSMSQNKSETSNLKQSTLSFNQNKCSGQSMSSNDSNITKEEFPKKSNVFDKVKQEIIIDLDNSFEVLPTLNKDSFKKPNKPVNINSPRSQSCRPKGNKLQKSKDISTSNHNLLDLWATVRRSERSTDKVVKERKEQSIIQKIKYRKEEGMRIINIAEKGRGIESTVAFSKDSFIVEYAGDLVTEKEAIAREAEYQKDPTKGSYMFHFKYINAKYCVDATAESGRLGRLLNHSKMHPNCHLKIIPMDNKPRLTIFAKRDIDLGEELVYDYGDRDKATIDANPWLKY